jgi:hypothetical protein
MPNNGEMNFTSGVYRNLCCGTEIVIPAGWPFPDCAKHVGLNTHWKLVENEDRILHVTELPDSKKRTA